MARPKYTIKVAIEVYENESCDTVLELRAAASANDQVASVKLANDLHDHARQMIAERSK